MSKFCTCNDRWTIMTCAKLWLYWIAMEIRAKWIFIRFHSLSQTWVPGLGCWVKSFENPFCSNFQPGVTSHYSDVIISMMSSQITGVLSVSSTICLSVDQWKHQSYMSLAFVRGIHQWLVDSPHKGPVRWKIFPLDDIIMKIFRPWNSTSTTCMGVPRFSGNMSLGPISWMIFQL